jgi:hypothetical protein
LPSPALRRYGVAFTGSVYQDFKSPTRNDHMIIPRIIRGEPLFYYPESPPGAAQGGEGRRWQPNQVGCNPFPSRRPLHKITCLKSPRMIRPRMEKVRLQIETCGHAEFQNETGIVGSSPSARLASQIPRTRNNPEFPPPFTPPRFALVPNDLGASRKRNVTVRHRESNTRDHLTFFISIRSGPLPGGRWGLTIGRGRRRALRRLPI